MDLGVNGVKLAETSSSLVISMRMPAGPKSLTEEDLRRMCQYEHCRKDGSKSEASRYFRIL